MKLEALVSSEKGPGAERLPGILICCNSSSLLLVLQIPIWAILKWKLLGFCTKCSSFHPLMFIFPCSWQHKLKTDNPVLCSFDCSTYSDYLVDLVIKAFVKMDDDDGFTPNSSFFGDIDIDFMEQLLDDGCWLQTADVSKLVQSPPSSPSGADVIPSDSISLLPALDIISTNLASTEAPCVELEAENNLASESHDLDGIQLAQYQASEHNRIWISPKADAGPSSSVKDRLMMAIQHFHSLTRESGLLIQIWVPVSSGIKSFLTTVEQPYSYDPSCAPLVQYRNVSEGYHFSADEFSKKDLGLPGRVFLAKLPEWTPDVRLFRQDEYPRVNDALMCDVRGSVALPVFESGSRNCVGVVEIVTTTQKINYRPEVESVCKALEAVNLRSSEIISPLKEKVETDMYDTELAEILRVIRSICDKHKLPIGQTWAPCTQHRKRGCWCLDKNTDCISTVDSAFYVRDERVYGFREECCEQHLFQDQGIVRKAFTTNQPCYVIDVTAYSKGEYPLSHLAKMFGLRGAIAVHLGCLYGAWKSYVLEFFLPIDCRDPDLNLHLEVMESLRMEIQGCHLLCFLSPKEIEQDVQFDGEEDERLESPSLIPESYDAQRKGKGVEFPFEVGEDLREEAGGTGGFEGLDDSIGDDCSLKTRKRDEKKSIKTQKSVSLQVLKQHFSGSLKDAARSIGVCPTTLKRICRQHGITRWPSRKIKKVGHSLKKLQLVIDSVEGARGSIKLSSFYSSFPDLGNPITENTDNENASGRTTSNSTSSKQTPSQPVAIEDPSSTTQAPVGHIKRARSEAQLSALKHRTTSGTERSHSKPLLLEKENHPSLAEGKNSLLRDRLAYKVKAMFGEDNIRFTLAPNMGFRDLQREMAARFSIGDFSRMQVKYMDDDKEWVLLTCDDDLEECVDIHRISGNHTVRLLVHQATPSLGSC